MISSNQITERQGHDQKISEFFHPTHRFRSLESHMLNYQSRQNQITDAYTKLEERCDARTDLETPSHKISVPLCKIDKNVMQMQHIIQERKKKETLLVDQGCSARSWIQPQPKVDKSVQLQTPSHYNESISSKQTNLIIKRRILSGQIKKSSDITSSLPSQSESSFLQRFKN